MSEIDTRPEYIKVVAGPRLQRTTSKFALKGKPLSGYRTGDIFYYKEFREEKVKVNGRAIVCVILSILLMSCIIVAVLYGANPNLIPASPVYNHSFLNISLSAGPICRYTRNCTTYCDTVYLEHLTGCCWGCGIADTCSFPVTVMWSGVNALTARLRVWLFVTLDGNFFFQSGYAPIVVNNTGSSIIGDSCLGEVGHPLILVACLSEQNLENSATQGFPASSCLSSYGICAVTGDALVPPLTPCLADGTWAGNQYTTSWPGALYSAASGISPWSLGTLLLFMVVFRFQ